MLSASASVPPPREYDALLPKLLLSSGPSWTKSQNFEETNFERQGKQNTGKTRTQLKNDVFESSGQQNAGIKLIELEKEGEHSDISNMNIEISSSGSGFIVVAGGNNNIMMITSGEKELDDHENAEENATISLLASGNGQEVNAKGVSGDIEESSDDSDDIPSGREEDGPTAKRVISFYSSGSGQRRETVEIVSPENSVSGSGHLEREDENSAVEDSTSGSNKYDYE